MRTLENKHVLLNTQHIIKTELSKLTSISFGTLILCFVLSILPNLTFGQGEEQPAKNAHDAHRVEYRDAKSTNTGISSLGNTGNREWTHYYFREKGYRDVYRELNRDQWSIYLLKETQLERSEITINLWTKKVTQKLRKRRFLNSPYVESFHELGPVVAAVQKYVEDPQIIIDEIESATTGLQLNSPVTDDELGEVMEWIGRELSRSQVDFCWKPTYGRGVGHTTKAACEASPEARGTGGCEKYLALWYPKCKEGYRADGCCICSWKCPGYVSVNNGAQNVQVDCGAACAKDVNACAQAVSDMVFTPINLALNIVSFGLAGAAKNAAKQAAIQGANIATGGAAAVSNGVTKAALFKNWTPLLNALWKSEKIVEKGIEAYDNIEYLKANVENLEAELERWNSHYADNFREYTNSKIAYTIDQKFTRKDDRIFIKRTFGQYMLTSMLESDGWRIAKTVLNAASIEPTGVIATVDAFTHPLCKTEANVFPNITIIPKGERGKLTKKVYFHSQNNMSLAQAHSLAKQNGWIVATEKQVFNAWYYLKFHAYAFGRMPSGRFAVPIQSDHTNFKKGANLGAQGGNQGFFYVKSRSGIPRLNNGYVRIQNNKDMDHYIHNQNGKLEDGDINGTWWSAHWKVVPAGGGWVRIQNRWKPDLYLNRSGPDKLEAVKIQPNWTSALWKMEPVHSGWVRLQNHWYKDEYIHTEKGKISVGKIEPHWQGALWKVE